MKDIYFLLTPRYLALDFVGPAEAPYNALSCDYAPALPGEVALRLTGFFVVQNTTVPTARGVRYYQVDPHRGLWGRAIALCQDKILI